MVASLIFIAKTNTIKVPALINFTIKL